MAERLEIPQTAAMLTARMVHWLLRFAVVGLTATIAAYALLFSALAWPQPFFSHQAAGGQLAFHSRAPLPPGAVDLGGRVTESLAASPLGLPQHPIDIWLVDEGWPVQVFFAGSTGAAGLTYPVISPRSVFLRHADLSTNRLVHGVHAVPPPRTLSYFLIHEITHLMVAERVGRAQTLAIPRWIHEGFADYVALGPAPPAMLAQAQSGARLPAREFGTYARERVCVTLALARLGGDLDRLLALRGALTAEALCPPSVQFGIAPLRVGS